MFSVTLWLAKTHKTFVTSALFLRFFCSVWGELLIFAKVIIEKRTMDAAISRYEDPLVNLYWNVLRTLNKSIRLNLAAKLTASVAEEEREVESAVSNPTRAMLDKYYGTWVGNESAADTLRAIKENSTSRQPLAF